MDIVEILQRVDFDDLDMRINCWLVITNQPFLILWDGLHTCENDYNYNSKLYKIIQNYTKLYKIIQNYT